MSFLSRLSGIVIRWFATEIHFTKLKLLLSMLLLGGILIGGSIELDLLFSRDISSIHGNAKKDGYTFEVIITVSSLIVVILFFDLLHLFKTSNDQKRKDILLKTILENESLPKKLKAELAQKIIETL